MAYFANDNIQVLPRRLLLEAYLPHLQRVFDKTSALTLRSYVTVV
jgi:hypothetical protein